MGYFKCSIEIKLIIWTRKNNNTWIRHLITRSCITHHHETIFYISHKGLWYIIVLIIFLSQCKGKYVISLPTKASSLNEHCVISLTTETSSPRQGWIMGPLPQSHTWLKSKFKNYATLGFWFVFKISIYRSEKACGIGTCSQARWFCGQLSQCHRHFGSSFFLYLLYLTVKAIVS